MDELELVISQTMLAVSGVIKRHRNPAVHTPEMNKELDKIFHEAKTAIQVYCDKQSIGARKEELKNLHALPNIQYQDPHVQAIYKSAIKDRLAELESDPKEEE